MNADSLDRIEQLFRAAQVLPIEERTSFLEKACADEPAIYAQVEGLLAAYDEVTKENFMGSGKLHVEDALESMVPDDDLVGKQVGAYQVLRRLGQGGMGDVYLGAREEPFRHYVALKVIRRGTNSRDVIARFSIERQILASLNHPGIARLIDGGVTSEDLPYFAMEYVEGQPIIAYCDERKLSLNERMHLFLHVCNAVHYAHQNLVLHRDLKPSNILVTTHGEVKLLDFGIAKLMNPQLSRVPVPVTREAQRLLTPEYASPEQLRGDPLSTASDVYSLGVMLYQLLTGAKPHQLDGKATHKIIQIVTEEEPLYPSRAITQGTTEKTSTEPKPESPQTSSIAKARNLTLDRLRRSLRGDLDAITLMALRKEPNHRYGSAQLLAQDIERHLKGEAVLARRGTRRYRLSKFIRRHQVVAIAAAIVLFSLVGGLGIALWQGAEARIERDRATMAQAQAEEVTQFLEGLFVASDPYRPVPERIDTLQLRTFLSRGVDKISTGLSDQPLVQARMMGVVGRVFSNLGLYDEAQPLLEQQLSTYRGTYKEPHPDIAESLMNMATLIFELGDYARAQALLEEALEINKQTLDNDHPAIAENLNSLGAALRQQGHFEEAQERHLEAIQMMEQVAGEQDPRMGLFLTDLVRTLEQKGDFEEARQYGQESVAFYREHYGDIHPSLALSLRELGLVLQRQGDYPEAEVLFRESIDIAEAALGTEHPQVADLLNRLASIRWWQEDLAAADSIHRKSLALKRRIYGDVHLEVAYSLNNLASVMRDKGEYLEAIELLHETLDILRQTVGDDHSDYWIVLSNLGKAHWAQGNCADAEPLLRQAIAGMERTIPNNYQRVPAQQRFLGDCLRLRGEFSEAETVLLESHEVFKNTRGADDAMTRSSAEMLFKLYQTWGKTEPAEKYRLLSLESQS